MWAGLGIGGNVVSEVNFKKAFTSTGKTLNDNDDDYNVNDDK